MGLLEMESKGINPGAILIRGASELCAQARPFRARPCRSGTSACVLVEYVDGRISALRKAVSKRTLCEECPYMPSRPDW